MLCRGNRLFIIGFFPILFLMLFDSVSLSGGTDELKERMISRERQLMELEQDIERKRKDIDRLQQQKDMLIDEVYSLDRLLKKEEEALSIIRQRQRLVEKELSSLEERLTKLQERQYELEDMLRGRLVAAYKMRRGGILRVLLSARDLFTIRRNYRYLLYLISYDLDLLKEYDRNIGALREAGQELEEKRQLLASLRSKEERRKSEIERDRRRKRAIVRRIKRERELKLVAIKRLKEASLRLESKIDELRRRLSHSGGESGGLGSLKGRLMMPVSGKIVSFYGRIKDPESNTITFHKGIEIESKEGSQVRSVYAGKVIFSDWFRGYGKMIIVDNGGGYYTVYAHLSKRFKDVGEIVKEGDVIGLVGDTDSLKGSRLYFEIRYHSRTMDPLEWFAMGSR